METTREMVCDVFNLGDDLWLWKSPYTFDWIFHHPSQNDWVLYHPMQNGSKPNSNDSLTITVKNEESKIVGIQNIKWNDHGQIVYKNKASYKSRKQLDYKSEGVSISNSLVLEHEVNPCKKDSKFGV